MASNNAASEPKYAASLGKASVAVAITGIIVTVIIIVIVVAAAAHHRSLYYVGLGL